tara:strand:+ start:175 stop:855 length:681 start_codon:yes stop_codon:yes gene_type:complete
MKIYAFIFARGGSKGIKDKNLVKVKGKPLIYYSIKIAQKIKDIDKIFVSSDSEKILKYAKKLGVSIIKRPKKISGDSSPEVLAWRHAITYLKKKDLKFDIFLSLPPTAPLRKIEDVKRVLRSIKEKKVNLVVTAKKSHNSPWFNMIIKNKKGYFERIINNKNLYKTRQSTPRSFDMTTVAYASKPNYILKYSDLMKGNVKMVEIPEERAVDIDTKFDLSLVRFLKK